MPAASMRRIWSVRLAIGTQFTRSANKREFMQLVTGEPWSRLIKPGRAGWIASECAEFGVLLQQAGLELIQLRPDLIL